MWKQWVNALLGLVTIAMAFMGLTGSALAWTLGITGLLVLGISLWTVSEVSSEEYERAAHHQHA